MTTTVSAPTPSPTPPPATPAAVANWMLQELTKRKVLYQADVVYDIAKKFGKTFTDTNKISGNLVISKSVLRAFKSLTSTTVVWDKRERMWRFREKGDDPGKRQAES